MLTKYSTPSTKKNNSGMRFTPQDSKDDHENSLSFLQGILHRQYQKLEENEKELKILRSFETYSTAEKEHLTFLNCHYSNDISLATKKGFGDYSLTNISRKKRKLASKVVTKKNPIIKVDRRNTGLTELLANRGKLQHITRDRLNRIGKNMKDNSGAPDNTPVNNKKIEEDSSQSKPKTHIYSSIKERGRSKRTELGKSNLMNKFASVLGDGKLKSQKKLNNSIKGVRMKQSLVKSPEIKTANYSFSSRTDGKKLRKLPTSTTSKSSVVQKLLPFERSPLNSTQIASLTKIAEVVVENTVEDKKKVTSVKSPLNKSREEQKLTQLTHLSTKLKLSNTFKKKSSQPSKIASILRSSSPGGRKSGRSATRDKISFKSRKSRMSSPNRNITKLNLCKKAKYYLKDLKDGLNNETNPFFAHFYKNFMMLKKITPAIQNQAGRERLINKQRKVMVHESDSGIWSIDNAQIDFYSSLILMRL